MTGEALTKSSSIMCPHGGQASLSTSNSRTKTEGSEVLLETDVHMVSGCPFYQGNSPSPCVKIEWSAGATRVKVDSVPVLKKESTGLCYSPANAMQGNAVIVSTQMKVSTQ